MQAQREPGRRGMPFTTAIDAPGTGRQLHVQALQRQARTVARLAAELEFDRADRQALLIPAPRLGIGQGDAGADGGVEAAAVDVGAASQARSRQAAAERGQIEVLRAGHQGGQRPGGERLQAGLGAQRGAGGFVATELGLQAERCQRAAGTGTGLPGRGDAIARARIELGVERKRGVAGDAAAAFEVGLVPVESQLLDAVFAAAAGAQFGVAAELGQRGLAIDVQRVDAGGLQRQHNRQAQTGRRRQRLARRRAADLDAHRVRRHQHHPGPCAAGRAPGPARVLPRQAVHGQRALAEFELEALGAERAAGHPPDRAAGAEAGHARQQPGAAAVAAQQPSHAASQQQGGGAARGQRGQQPAARRASRCDFRRPALHRLRTRSRPTSASAIA